MMLTQAGHRPAHLTRVRDALTTLLEPGQVRLGVIERWRHLRAVLPVVWSLVFRRTPACP